MYYNRDSGDVAYRHQPISPLLSLNDGRVHFEESHSEAASATSTIPGHTRGTSPLIGLTVRDSRTPLAR
jgi:hypothetical protein